MNFNSVLDKILSRKCYYSFITKIEKKFFFQIIFRYFLTHGGGKHVLIFEV